MRLSVRATAVLIEHEHILLVRQRVSSLSEREWSLPGGAVEFGETIEQCLVREVHEETGLEVALDRLLYVCDRIEPGIHVIHVTFAVRRISGSLRMGAEPEPHAQPISDAKMVPLAALLDYGFSVRFCELIAMGFPDAGTYQGAVASIGL